MANTKISQLPSYTGTAADIRWFVMNNSGETETYKYSGYSSQLIPGTGGGETYRTPSATASGTDSIAIGNGATHDTGTDGIAIGKNAFATSNRSTSVGGSSYSVGASSAYGWGAESRALGANTFGYYAKVYGQYSTALGGENFIGSNRCIAVGVGNYMDTGTYNIVMGDSIALTSGSYNTILNGKTNTFSSTGSYNNIFNGSGNTLGSSFSAVTMLSTMGRTATRSDATMVENLVVFNYSNLNFANDTAAAAGGVVLGQVYHDNGLMRIRIV